MGPCLEKAVGKRPLKTLPADPHPFSHHVGELSGLQVLRIDRNPLDAPAGAREAIAEPGDQSGKPDHDQRQLAGTDQFIAYELGYAAHEASRLGVERLGPRTAATVNPTPLRSTAVKSPVRLGG